MDNSALQQIRDTIEKNQAIAIVVGENPTMDEMAAALSLYLSLKDSGKSVQVTSPTEPIVAISTLVGIDKVKTSLSGDGGDLVVSFPYQEGEIEKISYTLEQNKLNIIVKAGPQGLSFSENDVMYKHAGGSVGLLFVVGSETLARLKQLFDAEGLKNTTIVNIDNKRDNQQFGDIVYVSPTASSVSELVANLLVSLSLPLPVDASQNLLDGIASATDNFQSQQTSATAFEMAGRLLKTGAQRLTPAAPIQMPDAFFTPKTSQQPRLGVVKPQPALANPFNDDFINAMPPSQFKPQTRMPRTNFPQPQFRPQQQQKAVNPFASPTLPNQPATPQPANPPKKSPPNDWLTPKIYKGSTQV